ncbi:hypothetical protein PTTG_29358 [Puccinia triticina 1-1 BBBD Race 1]|uniref:Uncharacterized protein n=1 Tax=Puccinia triticina (isolate 1-1 / race 1 (BBBD)) TaxID=630390 RepID=A0A180G4U9_PUCT1|nr:hypothetical protein PTTG_29358 [Puccinia triticina 1-1 BBBD Race 1]
MVLPCLETLQNFANQWKRVEFKAPYTSIVGPTMSGKTRLLMELAHHTCVVYICLRPANSTGQPPCSELAQDMVPLAEQKKDMNILYLSFLTAIFKTVTKFFSKKKTAAQPVVKQLQEWTNYSFQKNNTPKTKFNASVLIALDEASNLIDPIDKTHNVSYFCLFCRALSEIPKDKGIFSVFTDTNSRVANFSPSSTQDPSARGHELGYELFAPMYKISTLDLFADDVNKPPKDFRELESPARLFNYGCPFYGLYFKGATAKGTPDPIGKTAMIAGAKLLGLSKPPTLQELTLARCFALLGSMIQTRLSSHSPINSTLVSSHAAHCVFIDSTREMVLSDYPPQFVYAAAANAYLVNKDACWVKCIKELAIAVQKGLVALGDAGEMATRIILIRAMQKTQQRIGSKEKSIPGGSSVRLVDFLETLTGKPRENMLRGLHTEKDKNKSQLLDRGRIFFNHLSRIEYTPDASDLMNFLYRGVAVQCKRGQRGLDELFTIYLEPTPGVEPPKLDLKNITFCGVQTKNQSSPLEWKDSFKWSKSYTEIEGIDRLNPYLILLFNLRGKPDSTIADWISPSVEFDKTRVYYQFFGLEQIQCLTPEMRSALNQLIYAIPEDFLKIHDRDDEITEKWIKHLSPIFYSRKNRETRLSGKRRRSSAHSDASAKAEAKCILQKQAGPAKIDSLGRNNRVPKQAQHKKKLSMKQTSGANDQPNGAKPSEPVIAIFR